jgi:hypothetical protein
MSSPVVCRRGFCLWPSWLGAQETIHDSCESSPPTYLGTGLTLTATLQKLHFIFVILGAFLGCIAFWINLGFVLNSQSHVTNYTGGVWRGRIRNVFWLSFGVVMALSLATCFSDVGAFIEEERGVTGAPVPAVHESLVAGGRELPTKAKGTKI